jgi:signal transduction histidine kinase
MDAGDYQIIRDLLDDYLRMYSSRDDRLTTHFSEDFSGFTGGGSFLVKDREEWVAITRQDFAQIKDPIRIELKDVAIQSLTDMIAVATSFFTIHLPIKDHILSRETARLVLIFRKESADWKISHSSISIPYHLVREGEIYPLKELVDRNQVLEELVEKRTIQLSEANVELERLNLLKNQFLGMAAHDLRTPIGHILSYSDFLREEVATVLTEEQLEFLSIIRSSSEFMLQLIDDCLDVSSIESGNLRLDRRLSDPRKLLECYVGLNAVLAQKKSIQVALQIEGTLPVLSLDEGKIAQVLNNLISNAIKFSQPGTAVAVCAVAEGSGVRIAVRDQGPGIPEGERDKLFQAFGQTSVHSTAGESSTGLGLAIVRRIVEGHGGRIWVESQVGVGSVFLFTLPA